MNHKERRVEFAVKYMKQVLIKVCLPTNFEQPWMAQMGSQEVGY